MKVKTDKWCISRDGETFWEIEAVTREQAIDEGLYQLRRALAGNDTDCFDPSGMPKEGACFYIGIKADYAPCIDEVTVIEQLQMDAYEECGEVGEGYLERIAPLEQELLKQKLQSAFDEWIKETGNEPWFYVVQEVEEIKVADHQELWRQIREKAAGSHEQHEEAIERCL